MAKNFAHARGLKMNGEETDDEEDQKMPASSGGGLTGDALKVAKTMSSHEEPEVESEPLSHKALAVVLGVRESEAMKEVFRLRKEVEQLRKELEDLRGIDGSMTIFYCPHCLE